MSIGKTETKVYFYTNDYNRVCAEIYRHPDIETGGNLFGLWTTEGNVVVHAALGPGKKCRRTDVSFHQDIEYMSRVGTFLNTNFMLCHIGEWHSHHQLRLNKPSAGDNRTIRQNYPNGVKKFLVIIGNIVDNDRVVLSPYFFSENGNICEKGEFKVLDADSPFTTDSMIAETMNENAETQNHPYCSSPSPNNDQQKSASEGSSSANGRSEPSATDTGSNSNNKGDSSSSPNKDQKQSVPESSCRSQQSSTVIEVMDTEDTGANGHSQQSAQRGSVSNSDDVSPGAVTRCTKSTTLQIRIPPRDYQTSTMSQPTVRSPSERTRATTPPADSVKYLSASNEPSTTNSASATCTKSDDDSKQTRKEAILKKVFDEIKSKFNDSGIDMERSTNSGVVEMKFKHVDRHWLIRFPESFPETRASIFSSHSDNFSYAIENYSSKPDFLNNYVDILLSIKRECKFASSNCSSCRRMDVQSLTLSDLTLDLFLTEEGNTMIKQLLDEAKNTFPDFKSLKKEMKCDGVWKNAVLEVSFTHSSILWIIKVNSTFPSCPAKIYFKDERKHSGDAIYETRVYFRSSQYSSKDWASTVLQEIKRECACVKCKG